LIDTKIHHTTTVHFRARKGPFGSPWVQTVVLTHPHSNSPDLYTKQKERKKKSRPP